METAFIVLMAVAAAAGLGLLGVYVAPAISDNGIALLKSGIPRKSRAPPGTPTRIG